MSIKLTDGTIIEDGIKICEDNVTKYVSKTLKDRGVTSIKVVTEEGYDMAMGSSGEYVTIMTFLD